MSRLRELLPRSHDESGRFGCDVSTTGQNVTLNMRYRESESPQDSRNIYALRQSESTACPAAKVSTCRWNTETNGHAYLFIWSVGLHAFNVIVRFSSSGREQVQPGSPAKI